MRHGLVIGAVAVSAALSPAKAADVADFYKGKQLSLVVNYTAGGPTDTEARLLARHLPKHIPGNPGITVRNMGGAGGMIGVNWLGQIAVPDGLTFGYMTGIAGASAHETPALKVDATKLPFISGVEGVSVYYARSDLGGGVAKPEDILKKSGFWIGGLTPDNDKDLRIRCELDLLGLTYRYISGYPGAAEARLALEQNEIQLTAESMPTYRLSIEPALVKTGKVVPLWYDTTQEAAAAPHPDAQGIEALPYQMFYRRIKGEPRAGDQLWRMCMLLNEIGGVFQRTINLPPNAPPEAVTLLRQAFVGLVGDEDYRRDALNTIKFMPRFPMGPKVEAIFRGAIKPDQQMKDFILDYIEKGKAMVGK